MSPGPRLLLVLICTIPGAARLVALKVNSATGSSANKQGAIGGNRTSFKTFVRDLKHRVAIFHTKDAEPGLINMQNVHASSLRSFNIYTQPFWRFQIAGSRSFSF